MLYKLLLRLSCFCSSAFLVRGCAVDCRLIFKHMPWHTHGLNFFSDLNKIISVVRAFIDDSTAKIVREFWIYEHHIGRSMNGRHKLYSASDELPQNTGWLHVIEYSAYAALEVENKKLKNRFSRQAKKYWEGNLDSTLSGVNKLKSDNAALEAKLAECVSALEFYACKANWELSEITLDQDRKPFWYLRTEIKNDCEEFEDKDARGGKLAREVLARIRNG